MLPQHCVLHHQCGLAAREVHGSTLYRVIQDGVEHQRVIVGLCPLAQTPFNKLAKRIYTVSYEGKEWYVHGPPF